AVLRAAPRQQARRRLRLRVLLPPALLLRLEVQLGDRVAELLPARRPRKRGDHGGSQLRHAAHRDPVHALRLPPRARVGGRPEAHGHALLRHLRVAGLRRQERSGHARRAEHHMKRCFGAALALLALAGCAAGPSIVTSRQDGTEERIPATLVKPDGPGPFPAVVMLHDCSGLGPTSSGAPARWAGELVSRGYVVLIPDSFTSRGYPGGICSEPSPTNPGVFTVQRARDAHAALAHLR